MKAFLRSDALVCAFFFTSTMSSLGQGALTPPAAPTPTMKSLDQIEPRKIVNAANTPGDANNQFIISAPGSYYLTGNITGVSGKSGIAINADDVTLDLNGFALIGVGAGDPGANSGITGLNLHRNWRIHNGSAHGWNFGIDCRIATNCQFDHLRVSQNFTGFACGDGCVLSEISAEANTTNTSSNGIVTGNRCTLSACSAFNNTNSGVLTGDSCTITASTAVGNHVGFNIQNQCSVSGCTAVSNVFDGFEPTSNCTIKDCLSNLNSVGIRTYGSNNRLDGNHCLGNSSYGIRSSTGTADFTFRNTCFGNGGAASTNPPADANYYPSSGTYFGPLSTPGSATSPWANF